MWQDLHRAKFGTQELTLAQQVRGRIITRGQGLALSLLPCSKGHACAPIYLTPSAFATLQMARATLNDDDDTATSGSEARALRVSTP